jgi:hypothetical protein
LKLREEKRKLIIKEKIMDLTKEEIRKAIIELEDNEEWDENLFAEENSFPFLSKEARKNYSEYLGRKYYVEVKEEGKWFQLSIKKGNETKELILSTDNLSLKAHKYDCHRMWIENFSYKSGNLPELPEGTPKLSYSGNLIVSKKLLKINKINKFD